MNFFFKALCCFIVLLLICSSQLAAQDTDGDGLSDADETGIYFTDPFNIDTDGDYFTDGDEVLLYASNPLVADLPPCDAGITDVVRLISDPVAVLCIGDSQPCGGDAADGTFIAGGLECCGVAGNNSCATLSIELGPAVGGLGFEIFGAASFEAYNLTPTGCNLIADPASFCAPADRFRILICKPGASWNNSIGLTPVAALDLVVNNSSTYEGCDPVYQALGTAAPVTWSTISPAADLAYFDCGSGPGVNITCTNPTFTGPAITDCNGVDFTYQIEAIDDCTGLTQMVTRTAIVYPDITADITNMCNAAGTMSTLSVINDNCTNYEYLWSNLATTSTITVPSDGSTYSVTVTNPIVSVNCTSLIMTTVVACCGANNGTTNLIVNPN